MKTLAMLLAIIGVWCFRAANKLDPMPEVQPDDDLTALDEWLGFHEHE